MKKNERDYYTDMMIRRIADCEPVVAYMAHPYEMKEVNLYKSRDMAKKLAVLHPYMAIITPLDNFRCLIRESDILKRSKQVLKRCDALIMTGDWKASPLCMVEVSFAYNRGIPIIEPDEESARFFHPAVIFKD